MPPDFPTWFFYALAASAVVFFAPKLWEQLRRGVVWAFGVLGAAAGEVVAPHIAEKLEQHLQPSWEADFEEMLSDALAPIYIELKDNGGSSLKDVVTRSASDIRQIQQDIEPIVREYNARRYDPPEGHPA